MQPSVPSQRLGRVVLIEGLPGSGKTSLAEALSEQIGAQGRAVSWVPELHRNHPVIDRPTMRTAKVHGYADRCIERWAAFSREVQTLDSPEVLVLEGCLFQSTVRFLIEYERSADEIDSYLPAVENCLAPLHPHLVYLTQTDTEAYLRDELVRRKGDDIVSRIAAYSATTPYAIRRGLQGSAALVSLYAAYRRACDRLVRRSDLPVLEIDVVRFDESAVRDQAASWLRTAISG